MFAGGSVFSTNRTCRSSWSFARKSKSEIQICAAEIIAVSLRLPVRKQGRAEHDETRVRGFKLPAILKEADARVMAPSPLPKEIRL